MCAQRAARSSDAAAFLVYGRRSDASASAFSRTFQRFTAVLSNLNAHCRQLTTNTLRIQTVAVALPRILNLPSINTVSSGFAYRPPCPDAFHRRTSTNTDQNVSQ